MEFNEFSQIPVNRDSLWYRYEGIQTIQGWWRVEEKEQFAWLLFVVVLLRITNSTLEDGPQCDLWEVWLRRWSRCKTNKKPQTNKKIHWKFQLLEALIGT